PFLCRSTLCHIPYHFLRHTAILIAKGKKDQKAAFMTVSVVPMLANDSGAEKIFVGIKELQCIGARPPFDHPHVTLDMGADSQILCPYCSTLYVYDARLGPEESDPRESIVRLSATK